MMKRSNEVVYEALGGTLNALNVISISSQRGLPSAPSRQNGFWSVRSTDQVQRGDNVCFLSGTSGLNTTGSSCSWILTAGRFSEETDELGDL